MNVTLNHCYDSTMNYESDDSAPNAKRQIKKFISILTSEVQWDTFTLVILITIEYSLTWIKCLLYTKFEWKIYFEGLWNDKCHINSIWIISASNDTRLTEIHLSSPWEPADFLKSKREIYYSAPIDIPW